MNQNIIVKWSFYLQIGFGLIDMVFRSPEYGLPFNSGWILILGLLTIISELENKK